MEIGLVKKVNIEDEMQQSYLDYAMSVIVARALPDARDGLKPVQRRILYAMGDMGLSPNAGYKKSARIVGEVLGKYHPHGDMAVYEAMARMAQDFSLRYPLVDGQGNFGSVDGDPPAAMRYTEAKLHPFAIEMLGDLERNTVNFIKNFDETIEEPEVLPAAVPNLLVNGSSGIAVGMATNIPPHNLGEVLDAMDYMLGKWDRLDDVNIDELMKYIQGPDFPTGGIILQEGEQNDLLSAYATGRGKVLVRGRVQLEEMGRGRDRIIITELPYMTNKSTLIERIAELVRENNLEGIADLRDESDRHGMRIVVELKQGADTDHILRELYRRTPLQATIGITMLALVGGEPRLMTLKQSLRVYLEHRLTIVKRRSEYDLAKAKGRMHILEGLRIAINNIDEIISMIRNAPDVEEARKRLIKKFKLSEIQAQAILDMPLRRLSTLERKKIELEYKDILKIIKELEVILHSPKKMRDKVGEELLKVKELYADRRRTHIVSLKPGESSKVLLTTKDITPAHPVWVGVMPDGVIARVTPENLSHISGKVSPIFLIKTNTHHTLYLVSKTGKTAAVSVEALPETEKLTDGVLLEKVSPLESAVELAGVISCPQKDEIMDDHYVITVSRLGMIKRSLIKDLPGPSSQSFFLSKVNSGDEVIDVIITMGNTDIFLVTSQGMAIRFSEEEVRPMGLVAAGVNAIKLGAKDYLIGAESILKDKEVVLLSTDGLSWRLKAEEFPVQGRYGQGVKACKINLSGRIGAIFVGRNNQIGLVKFLHAAAKSVRIDNFSLTKRTSVGKMFFNIKEKDRITGMTPIKDLLAFWNEKPKDIKKTRGRKKKV